jgi:sterol desaturase/sphingolipid hydroxylase (fatty acid hydroxylase superfamily)
MAGDGPTLELFRTEFGSLLVLEVTALVALPVLGVVYYGLERLRPVDPARVTWRQSPTDVVYFLLGPLIQVLSRLCTGLVMIGLASLAGYPFEEVRHGFGPVMKQPGWLILLEMALILELTAYWTHRLSHTVPWLWRFHSIHHSSKRLSWLSAVRSHPLNNLYIYLTDIIPLFVLGFPLDALTVLFPFIAFNAMLTHTNLNITLRPISYLITTPVYHRFHHTLSDQGGHKNFAAGCPFFDKIFGTYYLPRERPLVFGVDEDDVPESFTGQLLHPFRSRAPNRGDESAPLAALGANPPPSSSL